jgi:hypothetical protein
MKSERRPEHRKNKGLEEILAEVNSILGPVEALTIANYKKNKYPLILIVGCARSGTTLLMQWLSSLGCFCYPTNILSRFYAAPYIGAKIQLMLTKYDFKNEIFDFNKEIPFTSNLGKTKGALAPHEFWYFWNRFFKFGEIQYLSEEMLKSVDDITFVSELAAIEAAFNLPLAMKASIANWNIPYLSSKLDKVLFVHVKRHPFYNIQSLLEARMKFYGDIKAWYSFKPPEFNSLKDLSPYEQVTGQVYHTNRAVEMGLQQLEEARVLGIDYEQFCQSPENVFKQIVEKLQRQGYQVNRSYNGPNSFGHTNSKKMSNDEAEKIIAAYKKFSGETLTL